MKLVKVKTSELHRAGKTVLNSVCELTFNDSCEAETDITNIRELMSVDSSISLINDIDLSSLPEKERQQINYVSEYQKIIEKQGKEIEQLKLKQEKSLEQNVKLVNDIEKLNKGSEVSNPEIEDALKSAQRKNIDLLKENAELKKQIEVFNNGEFQIGGVNPDKKNNKNDTEEKRNKLMETTVKELKSIASDAGLPEKEWKDLNKSKLVDYLLSQI